MSHLYPFPTKVLWQLQNVNWGSGSDQPFTCAFTATPPIDTRSGLYVVTGVYLPAWPGAQAITGTPTGGIFDGASGGGNAIVASTQVWSNASGTFAAKLNSAVCIDPYTGGQGPYLTATNPPRLFLNVTGGGGNAATIYICGVEISALF